MSGATCLCCRRTSEETGEQCAHELADAHALDALCATVADLRSALEAAQRQTATLTLEWSRSEYRAELLRQRLEALQLRHVT